VVRRGVLTAPGMASASTTQRTVQGFKARNLFRGD
jgi:hypothetical protein